MSGLIWVQTVCKGYQQMAMAGKKLINFQEQINSDQTAHMGRLLRFGTHIQQNQVFLQ